MVKSWYNQRWYVRTPFFRQKLKENQQGKAYSCSWFVSVFLERYSCSSSAHHLALCCFWNNMSPSSFLSLELASMHHLALCLHYHLFNSSAYSALGSPTVAGNGEKDGSLFLGNLQRLIRLPELHLICLPIRELGSICEIPEWFDFMSQDNMI